MWTQLPKGYRKERSLVPTDRSVGPRDAKSSRGDNNPYTPQRWKVRKWHRSLRSSFWVYKMTSLVTHWSVFCYSSLTSHLFQMNGLWCFTEFTRELLVCSTLNCEQERMEKIRRVTQYLQTVGSCWKPERPNTSPQKHKQQSRGSRKVWKKKLPLVVSEPAEGTCESWDSFLYYWNFLNEIQVWSLRLCSPAELTKLQNIVVAKGESIMLREVYYEYQQV